MKKWIIVTLLFCIVVGYLADRLYSYYAPPIEHKPYSIPPKTPDDTLRIAYIGDSWAFMHKEHDCLVPKIIGDSLHMPIKVHSYGICGQTSKELYESLNNSTDLKQFLQKRRYDYCFISIGINDTYKKMSIEYYQHSMDNILRFLIANNIYPIILEIPDYDIIKAYDRQKLSRKILRKISMYINKTPINCKQIFRNALDEMVLKKNYINKVSIIRYKTWNKNGNKDLHTLYLNDGMHLNEKGYAKLDSCIIEMCKTLQIKKEMEKIEN
jgi:lysophospholipase L1-like esterase